MWYNNIIVCVNVKVFLNFGDIYPCQWVVWRCVVSPRGGYNPTPPNSNRENKRTAHGSQRNEGGYNQQSFNYTNFVQ
nr:MAG TPA: hypothetical protein [Caudoviricetes sp.]